MNEIVMYILLFAALYFQVFLLVSFLGRAKGGSLATSGHNYFPSTAIIVPCFNEGRTVEGTLRSLLALEYPREKLEILVVNDGSTDETESVIQRFLTTLAPEERAVVRTFSKENGGKHSAMNLALAQTNAELIGCLDADSIATTKALLAITPLFADARIAAVTPGIHVKDPRTILQHLQNVEYRLSIFNRFVFSSLGSAFITPGPFSIFRTSAVRRLGGWREGHSTEDMELALRLQKEGYFIANAPKAVVLTATPATLRALFRQRVRWTYGFLRNAIDYRQMLGSRAYGNLGIIILPAAIISIGAALYFFLRIIYYFVQMLYDAYLRFQFSGIIMTESSFDPFFINTSVLLILIYVAIALVLALISIGSYIGTGRAMPPYTTPVFLLFYSFLAPLWLSAAVVRATLKTGVRWK